MSADMVDRMDAIRISEYACLCVLHDCVWLPALPELLTHLDKLVRSVVACVMPSDFVVQSQCLLLIYGGDHVPADPPLGHVVQSAE